MTTRLDENKKNPKRQKKYIKITRKNTKTKFFFMSHRLGWIKFDKDLQGILTQTNTGKRTNISSLFKYGHEQVGTRERCTISCW